MLTPRRAVSEYFDWLRVRLYRIANLRRVLINVVQGIQLVAGFVLLSVEQAGRATLYALAAIAAPAAVGLGWLTDEQGANVLTVVSVVLTVVGAILGVIFMKPNQNTPATT